MSKKLEGKIALITGGSTGIGLATAKKFVEEGAYVYITCRRKPDLDAAVASTGSNITAIQVDVAKFADLDRVFAQIGEEKGRLDIIFANAGFADLVPLGSITEEAARKNSSSPSPSSLRTMPALSPAPSCTLTARLSSSSSRRFPFWAMAAALW